LEYRERPAIFDYGIALVVTVVASVLRWSLHPWLEDGGPALHLAAMIIVAWLGGLGPCLFAQALILLVSIVFFGRPPGSEPDPPIKALVGMTAFFSVGIAVALLSQSVRAAQRKAHLTEQSLRDAHRRKDEFLAMLAHELRNPLAPIGNGLQILEIAGDDIELREEARVMMQRQFEHLVRLVDDLLDVSRIARGKIELKKESLALAAVVERAVEAVRPLTDGLGHQLIVETPSQPLWLRGDPVRLAQVITNLLTNAARYTDRGGEIMVVAERSGDWAVVTVRDTGIGIGPEVLPKVFDMFVQAEHGLSRGHGGLGLGLTLVKSLVQLHGGEVEARSDGLGKGSEFIVRLPLQGATVGDEGPQSKSDLAAPPRRILVLDDNTDAADSLARLLALRRHDVRVAHSGREALRIGSEFQPEIAILDLGMPGIDGFAVAKALRASANGSAIKLVALTGWGGPDDRERTQAIGFDHHFVKPITIEALESITAVSDDRA
jgi:signal transduction histidine kinase/ActR/RegA family two-component response regulator